MAIRITPSTRLKRMGFTMLSPSSDPIPFVPSTGATRKSPKPSSAAKPRVKAISFLERSSSSPSAMFVLSVSAFMPSQRVSPKESAPRIIGSLRNLLRRVIERNRSALRSSSPVGVRTAIPQKLGERISTPSIMACPPTRTGSTADSGGPGAYFRTAAPGRRCRRCAACPCRTGGSRSRCRARPAGRYYRPPTLWSSRSRSSSGSGLRSPRSCRGRPRAGTLGVCLFSSLPPSAVKRRHIPPYSLLLLQRNGAAALTAPQMSPYLAADALQLAQELGVGPGLLELGYKKLQLRRGLEGVQNAAHLPDPLGLGRLHEELLLARRGVLDVDGRVQPAVRQLPIEPELHVARALELLEDDLVHPAAGLDQRRGEDRQRAAVLDVPRRPEELLGRIQGRGIHATRQYPAARRGREVVGPREPGYAVEQHDHVLALLDETLDALKDQLGHRYVVVGGLVEGRGDDLGLLYAALPVGDLLRALVGEHHEEFGLGVVGCDGLGYLLQDRRLAGLGRRDHHAALALAYGGYEVYAARGDVVRFPLEA